MSRLHRNIAIGVALTALMLTASLPTFASVQGRKNTAIALTAATAYAAFQKNKTPAVLLALGSAAAWKNYEDARKHENKVRDRVAAYQQQYYRPASYRRPAARSYSRSYTRPRTTYRRSYSAPRHYSTASYAKPRYVAYPSRGHVSYAAYSTPSVSQSGKHVAQLQTQVAELKHQVELSKVQAENTALKAQLSQQKAQEANVQAGVTEVKSIAHIIAAAGLVLLGIFGLTKAPYRIVRKTQ